MIPYRLWGLTVSYPPVGRLPLLSARPAITFPAAEHHRSLAGTVLYCLMTEAHRCEQLAQGCYTACALSRFRTNYLLIASPVLYLLCHPCSQYFYQLNVRRTRINTGNQKLHRITFYSSKFHTCKLHRQSWKIS